MFNFITAGESHGKIFNAVIESMRQLMISTYTARYTRIKSGYLGQLIEWPEVITEGRTVEECRELLQDALQEMILAYREQNKEIPVG